jgi:hypothetical protein
VDEARGHRRLHARGRECRSRPDRRAEDSIRNAGVVRSRQARRFGGGSSRARDGDLQFARLERDRRSVGQVGRGDEEIRLERNHRHGAEGVRRKAAPASVEHRADPRHRRFVLHERIEGAAVLRGQRGDRFQDAAERRRQTASDAASLHARRPEGRRRAARRSARHHHDDRRAEGRRSRVDSVRVCESLHGPRDHHRRTRRQRERRSRGPRPRERRWRRLPHSGHASRRAALPARHGADFRVRTGNREVLSDRADRGAPRPRADDERSATCASGPTRSERGRPPRRRAPQSLGREGRLQFPLRLRRGAAGTWSRISAATSIR